MRHNILVLLLFFPVLLKAQTITVGAKHFTEGYILSEIIAQLLEHEGFIVERKFNLGGTMVCFSALSEKEIDIYPEYTGTILSEILKTDEALSIAQLRERLKKKLNLSISSGYGFNNTYALALKRTLAEDRNIRTVSDLRHHPGLSIGLSYEFLKRKDGWDNLAQAYSLPHNPVGLEHGLAYAALQEEKIQVTDAYSTDGEIQRYDLVILKDDLNFFPNYHAVSFYRKDLHAKAVHAVEKLSGQLSEQEMQSMNAAVLFQGKSYAEVAAQFLTRKGIHRGRDGSPVYTSTTEDMVQKIAVHLKLTFIALFLAIIVAIPLGILLYWKPHLAGVVLYITGLLQTIPSIALLAILIPLTGIGATPAVVALFLYALLPILRNTVTGLQSVDPLLKRVADGMGMSTIQKLKWVELPLSSPSILAGVRTAAVINIGTATLAAFIGAGGLGEYIVTGLALNNAQLILRGAIPAAILAILVELIFEAIEKAVVPNYRRKKN